MVIKLYHERKKKRESYREWSVVTSLSITSIETHLFQERYETDHWLSCQRQLWWFSPAGKHRPLNEPPFPPWEETLAWSFLPGHHGPVKKNHNAVLRKRNLCSLVGTGFVVKTAPPQTNKNMQSYQQNSYSHHSSSSCWHSTIHQNHMILAYVFRETQVMKLMGYKRKIHVNTRVIHTYT